MRVAGGDKAVLQQQALVVMGTVVDEGLQESRSPAHAPDLVTFGLVVEARFDLTNKRRWKTAERILDEVTSTCTSGRWLSKSKKGASA